MVPARFGGAAAGVASALGSFAAANPHLVVVRASRRQLVAGPLGRAVKG